jgi:hypothetical protein
MSLATFWAGIMGGGPGFTIEFSAANINVSAFALPPADALAGIEIDADGTIDRVTQAGNTPNVWTWAVGSGFDANDYDFMFDISVGALDGIGDPGNVWINGGGTIFWLVQETGIGTTTCTGTLRIRPAGGGGDIDTAGSSLSAEATP